MSLAWTLDPFRFKPNKGAADPGGSTEDNAMVEYVIKNVLLASPSLPGPHSSPENAEGAVSVPLYTLGQPRIGLEY